MKLGHTLTDSHHHSLLSFQWMVKDRWSMILSLSLSIFSFIPSFTRGWEEEFPFQLSSNYKLHSLSFHFFFLLFSSASFFFVFFKKGMIIMITVIVTGKEEMSHMMMPCSLAIDIIFKVFTTKGHISSFSSFSLSHSFIVWSFVQQRDREKIFERKDTRVKRQETHVSRIKDSVGWTWTEGTDPNQPPECLIHGFWKEKKKGGRRFHLPVCVIVTKHWKTFQVTWLNIASVWWQWIKEGGKKEQKERNEQYLRSYQRVTFGTTYN